MAERNMQRLREGFGPFGALKGGGPISRLAMAGGNMNPEEEMPMPGMGLGPAMPGMSPFRPMSNPSAFRLGGGIDFLGGSRDFDERAGGVALPAPGGLGMRGGGFSGGLRGEMAPRGPMADPSVDIQPRNPFGARKRPIKRSMTGGGDPGYVNNSPFGTRRV